MVQLRPTDPPTGSLRVAPRIPWAATQLSLNPSEQYPFATSVDPPCYWRKAPGSVTICTPNVLLNRLRKNQRLNPLRVIFGRFFVSAANSTVVRCAGFLPALGVSSKIGINTFEVPVIPG